MTVSEIFYPKNVENLLFFDKNLWKNRIFDLNLQGIPIEGYPAFFVG